MAERPGSRMTSSIPLRPSGTSDGTCVHHLSIAEWLEEWNQAPEEAAALLLQVARDCVGRGVIRGQMADDLVQEAVVRATANDAAAVRRAQPGTRMGAWVRGVVRNLALEEHRRTLRARRLLTWVREARFAGYAGGGEQAGSEPWTRDSRDTESPGSGGSSPTVAELTPRQEEAYSLFIEGVSSSAIGRHLGISRSAARERIKRSRRRLKTGYTTKDDREWAASLLSIGRLELDEAAGGLLRLHGQGLSHRAIGDLLGLTREAVRLRLRRMRRKWDP